MTPIGHLKTYAKTFRRFILFPPAWPRAGSSTAFRTKSFSTQPAYVTQNFGVAEEADRAVIGLSDLKASVEHNGLQMSSDRKGNQDEKVPITRVLGRHHPIAQKALRKRRAQDTHLMIREPQEEEETPEEDEPSLMVRKLVVDEPDPQAFRPREERDFNVVDPGIKRLPLLAADVTVAVPSDQEARVEQNGAQMSSDTKREQDEKVAISPGVSSEHNLPFFSAGKHAHERHFQRGNNHFSISFRSAFEVHKSEGATEILEHDGHLQKAKETFELNLPSTSDSPKQGGAISVDVARKAEGEQNSAVITSQTKDASQTQATPQLQESLAAEDISQSQELSDAQETMPSHEDERVARRNKYVSTLATKAEITKQPDRGQSLSAMAVGIDVPDVGTRMTKETKILKPSILVDRSVPSAPALWEMPSFKAENDIEELITDSKADDSPNMGNEHSPLIRRVRRVRRRTRQVSGNEPASQPGAKEPNNPLVMKLSPSQENSALPRDVELDEARQTGGRKGLSLKAAEKMASLLHRQKHNKLTGSEQSELRTMRSREAVLNVQKRLRKRAAKQIEEGGITPEKNRAKTQNIGSSREIMESLGDAARRMARTETIIKYKFKDQSLLCTAMLAGAPLDKTGAPRGSSNLRLALLGDKSINHALFDAWYRTNKTTEEATVKIQAAVSNQNFCKCAISSGLVPTSEADRRLYESRKNFRERRAAIVEALAGAVFEDSGHNFEVLTRVIRRIGLKIEDILAGPNSPVHDDYLRSKEMDMVDWVQRFAS